MPPTCLLDTYLLIFDHYRPDTFVFLRVFDVASTAYTSGFLLHLLACRFFDGVGPVVSSEFFFFFCTHVLIMR